MASHMLFNNFWGDMCVDNFLYLKLSPVFRDTLGKREGSFVYLWPPCLTTAQLCSCSKNPMALKAKNIRYLALCRESLLTLGLESGRGGRHDQVTGMSDKS